MKSLGRRAYERYSTLLGIGEQLGKGGKLQVGADAWENLTDRIRHHWETFARGYAKEIIELHEEHKRRSEAERERLAMRGDLFEREVRRRMAEIVATEKK